MDALQKAIDIFGSQAGLAEAIGVTQPAIANWIARGNIPPERAVAIEEATGGQVTRHDLLPKLFGPAPSRKRAA